jgi:glyoxylase-like metal-dependent hydrolase (beta-lactamase superfamily II)
MDFSSVSIKTTDLGHRTYELEGQGGNITVAVADDGVIMVDSEFAPLHDKIKAAISALTDKPIRYLIDTHFHPDHSGGNAAFAADGAVIVAQENVRTRLAAGTQGMMGNKIPPAPPDALPTKTYAEEMTIKLKGREAELRHFPAAHTDGDTYVYFADANVLATGDLVSIGRYPYIDLPNGGNIKGMLAGVDALLKIANDGTRIVPGHGPIVGKTGLVAYRTMLETARERMEKLISTGKSEDEVIAAKPFADLDTQLGASDQASRIFVVSVYRSLKM